MGLYRNLLLALGLAGAPLTALAADAWPQATDMMRVWHQRPLVAGGEATTVLTVARFVWMTPQAGVSAFASSPGTGGLRALWRTDLPAGFTTTAMAGYRAIGIGPGLPGSAFRQGPEAVWLLGRALGNGWQVNLRASYAHLWAGNPATADDETSGLGLYGANLGYQPVPRLTLVGGLLGQVAWGHRTGLKAHNLGPTLAVTYRF
jgi:hypothetical protein